MTPREEELQEQITVLENDLADANERIDHLRADVRFWKGEAATGISIAAKLQRELSDMTQLAADYKKANTWLKQQLRELRSAE